MVTSDSMRAAVYREPGRIQVETRPIPELGPRDALLRVSHCGICGSDLHMVMDGWGLPNSIGGHEFSGTITALGNEVSGFELGQLVVGGPAPGCGQCECCLSHRPGLCSRRDEPGVSEFQGAFAEYVRSDAAQLLPVPPGLSPRAAALAEPLAVALHAVALSGVKAGQRAVVTGAGPIGLLTAAALDVLGLAEIVVSEPSPLRRELALAMGASRAVEPRELSVPPLPFTVVPEAVDVAFECSGRPEAFELSLAQLRRTGRLVLVGAGMERPRLDPNRLLLNELVVLGSYCYDENGLADALDLLASGRLDVDPLIATADVDLDELGDAIANLASGRIGGKVMVSPSPREAS